MTLQDIGSIGELVGAIATVATLAYLAIQIRQNNSHMREATVVAKLQAIDRTVETFSRYRGLMAIPENAELYVRGVDSYRSLDKVEKVRFRAIMEELFFGVTAMLERNKAGMYKDLALAEQIDSLALLIQKPGVAEWWERSKHIFGGELVSEIESRANTSKLG
ncbi:MAG: hypothetical protein KDI33_01855 [Halioglobus sp.]|nr:hypothetical protein [Halioglobus sp.]